MAMKYPLNVLMVINKTTAIKTWQTKIDGMVYSH